MVVDNTPPDTTVTGGPEGDTGTQTATFTFAGTDNLTPAGSIVFAWRLDDGAWSSFAPATTVPVSGLAPGPHTFAVKARDAAGNEDPTPAQRSFTVGSLVSVTIVSPADGATVPAGVLLVRGTVQAGGADAGVAVNGVVAAVSGTTWVALVRVDPTVTALTAQVRTPGGGGAAATRAIAVLPPIADAMRLRALPESGVAPLAVEFSVSRSQPMRRSRSITTATV